MTKKKLTFGGKRLSPEILERYKKVSKEYDIPLNIVASTGATESFHGYDKRVEKGGNTQGLFHITRGAGVEVARKMLKNNELANKLASMSKNEYREHLLKNRELEDRLAGGYLKMSYDEAEGDPVKTYGVYNSGVGRNLKEKPLNKQHMQNMKNFQQRYEDSFNFIKAEEPMAKEKKKEEKGPIGGMSLMDPIQQMMIGSNKAEPNMSMEVQSMPRTKPEKPPVGPPPPPQAEREPASTKEEEAVKDTMVKATRPDPQDVGKQKGLTQFQKALSYFGPRLIAQLVGGNDALATTDAVMRGFESMQQEDADRQMRADAIRDRQTQQTKSQQARIDAAKSRANAKLAGETLKQQEALEQQLADSEASIREFQELDQALAQGGLTGPLDANLGKLERMFGTGGKKPSYRLRLEKLKVNEGLANIAKTKGAISDREMKLFLSPAPVLSDDESLWRDWIRAKMIMEQELQKRLSKRLNINSPEDQKQMVLFDDIERNIAAEKIEAEERKDMEMLREKRRRMQASPSANRRFK